MARSKLEIKAHKELEKKGYIVDYKARPFRVPRGYQVDYFGLFDLLAYKDGNIRLIAIKSAKTSGRDTRILKDKIKEFKLTNKHLTKEIWIYRKLKGDRSPTPRVLLLD